MILIAFAISQTEANNQPKVTLFLLFFCFLIPPCIAFLFPLKLIDEAAREQAPKIYVAQFGWKEGKKITPASLDEEKRMRLSQLSDGGSESTHPSLGLLASIANPICSLGRSGIVYDFILFFGWSRTLLISVFLLAMPLLSAINVLSIYATGFAALFGYMLLIGVIAARKIK